MEHALPPALVPEDEPAGEEHRAREAQVDLARIDSLTPRKFIRVRMTSTASTAVNLYARRWGMKLNTASPPDASETAIVST